MSDGETTDGVVLSAQRPAPVELTRPTPNPGGRPGAAARTAERAPDHSPAPTRRPWRAFYIGALVGADGVAAVAAVVACYALRSGTTRSAVDLLGWRIGYATLGLFSMVLWLLLLALAGGYRSDHPAEEWRDYQIPVKVALW
jgi:hypothetical protein